MAKGKESQQPVFFSEGADEPECVRLRGVSFWVLREIEECISSFEEIYPNTFHARANFLLPDISSRISTRGNTSTDKLGKSSLVKEHQIWGGVKPILKT